ncbi:hypothetical protein BBP40_000285 [Aspergillus hancockii]|nr:hypothetical protein BBP40_000285 [Aspergillus hancockii]
MPDSVPKPYSWGKTYANVPETYFVTSTAKAFSPTGMFGFHIATCQGNTPQNVSWESNWTVFFSRLRRHVLDLNIEVSGLWENFSTPSERVVERVKPV